MQNRFNEDIAFFQEIHPAGLVTCTVNVKRYESLFRSRVIPAVQQLGSLEKIFFVKDGALRHIAMAVMQTLKKNFVYFSRHFATPCLSRLPDLISCDFSQSDYIEIVSFSGAIANFH